MASVAAKLSSTLTLAYSDRADERIDAGLPVLAGAAVEPLFIDATRLGSEGRFTLYRSGLWTVGVASVAVTPETLERETHHLYRDILLATRNLHLARVWNYVPAINELGVGGLENYRAFCRGRSLAFEAELGAAYKASLPAASAVGTSSDKLTLSFAASEWMPRHLENPAYEYPETYGPRSPSFARASVIPTPGRPAVFISGTAAIRGHTTIAPADTLEQLTITIENLRAISVACGLDSDLGASRADAVRAFKVYLRHAEDYPAVAAALNASLLVPTDKVSYLHADICREALMVEIEATLV
ncbi:MAG TPA: hypothetical protein PLN52_20450 [Opitutaceae bacterium]|nr:hypothetical protein [Opitutaceae bacterium]